LTTPSATTTPQDVHFGAAVRASPDLTGDGIGEILVGAPEYKTIVPLANHRGAAVVYSGATFARLGTLLGGTADSLGDALLGGFADFDGDGFLEFIAAGSRGDAPALNCGTLQCVSLYPAFASTYCTAKTNSLGCVPSIAGNGSASVSSTAASLITCSNQINQKIGLLLYSHHPASLAFQGGTLCVQSPLSRTAQQSSGGSASGSDCTGAFGFDFNARIDSGVDATLVAGAQIFCQYWSRDPGSASTTSLSNGLNFLVNP
jgi:hypothetical protein